MTSCRMRRAQTVAAFLVKQGIPARQIEIAGPRQARAAGPHGGRRSQSHEPARRHHHSMTRVRSIAR